MKLTRILVAALALAAFGSAVAADNTPKKEACAEKCCKEKCEKNMKDKQVDKKAEDKK